jgi:hypothetical protein
MKIIWDLMEYIYKPHFVRNMGIYNDVDMRITIDYRQLIGRQWIEGDDQGPSEACFGRMVDANVAPCASMHMGKKNGALLVSWPKNPGKRT